MRTSDLCVPNAALYQAEPRPDHRLAGLAAANRAQNTSHPNYLGQARYDRQFASPHAMGAALRLPRKLLGSAYGGRNR